MIQGIKSSKGTVSIETFQGRLRLRLPRSLYEGKQKYITLGLADTEENRAIAEERRALAERDIKLDMFDFTHNKYKPGSHLTLVEPLKPKTVPKLDELYEKFIDFKRKSLSKNTIRQTFLHYRTHLKSLKSSDLQDAVEIRDWAISNLSADGAKRFLTRMNACCEWAKDSGLIDFESPFKGMAGKIKVPKSQRKTEEDFRAFSVEERDRILEAIKNDTFNPSTSAYKHSYYFPYMFFIFNTGCRPSEAIALEWKHILNDCSLVDFKQVIIQTEDGREIREGLKTQERRKFPCNAKMREFLQSIKPEDCKPDDLVFPAIKGGWINIDNFRKRVWKPVVEGLKIEYLPPYNCRHTFITLAIDNGLDADDIARLCGNSAIVIYEHYKSKKRELFVPEF